MPHAMALVIGLGFIAQRDYVKLLLKRNNV